MFVQSLGRISTHCSKFSWGQDLALTAGSQRVQKRNEYAVRPAETRFIGAIAETNIAAEVE